MTISELVKFPMCSTLLLTIFYPESNFENLEGDIPFLRLRGRF